MKVLGSILSILILCLNQGNYLPMIKQVLFTSISPAIVMLGGRHAAAKRIKNL
jgi:hypothetical protein